VNRTPTPTVTIPPVSSTTINLGSGDGLALVIAAPGTTMTMSGGEEVKNASIDRVDQAGIPAISPGGEYSFTGIAYRISPEGAVFDPYVTLKITLSEADWNALANKDLVIRGYNPATSQWDDFQTTVDPNTRTLSAKVTKTGIYGVFVRTPPTTVPTPVVTVPTPTPTPAGVLPFLPFDMMTLLKIIVVVIVIIAVVVTAVYLLRRRKRLASEEGEEAAPADESEEPPDWLDLK